MILRQNLFSLISVVVGAIALALIALQFTAGPFAPRHDVGVTVADIVAQAKDAALARAKGAPMPAAKPVPWDIDRVIKLVSAVAAVMALVLAALAMARKEQRNLVIFGISLGAAALVFQFLLWLALLICGLLLMSMVIGALDPG